MGKACLAKSFPPQTASNETIRDVAERLDAHRKRQQSLHRYLTLTEMYNVVEKLRVGEELNTDDRATYDARPRRGPPRAAR